jgi:hypothetical protein
MARVTDGSYPSATELDDDDIALVVQDGNVRRAARNVMMPWVGGIVVGPTPPSTTDVLWADTTASDGLDPSTFNVKDYGAVGNGVTDDTAAVQAAFTAAVAAPVGAVLLPPGTYLVGNLLFGNQQTGSQSTSPAALVGFGYSSMLKAKPGTTGTLLQAWSVAGVRFRDFTVDASDIAGITKAIDTEWKPGTGGSVQNIYDGVFVQNFAQTGWFARNNNDCSFRSVIVRQPTNNDAQVGIDLQGAGGVLGMNECIWAGCLLDICAQNATLRQCWGHGIRMNNAQTSDNVMHLDSCYIYANESADACIWDPSPATMGHWTRALTLTSTYFIVTTAGKSLFNVGLTACVNVNSCIAYITEPVNFFGPATVRWAAGVDTQVDLNSLSVVGGDTLTLNPVADIAYRRVLLDDNGTLRGPTASVASAATIAVPPGCELLTVTGTTSITSVTAGYAGQRVTLVFSGALTVTDGSNLKLAGNLVTTGDDTVTLVCDGTNWFETSRSVN